MKFVTSNVHLQFVLCVEKVCSVDVRVQKLIPVLPLPNRRQGESTLRIVNVVTSFVNKFMLIPALNSYRIQTYQQFNVRWFTLQNCIIAILYIGLSPGDIDANG